MAQNPSVLGPWRESGTFKPVVFVAPLVSFVVSLPLAALYALINIHVPILGVVTIFALAAFAGLAGAAGGLVMADGKSRNTPVTTLVSLVGALASLYSLWGFFLFFLLRSSDQDPNLLAILLDPSSDWQLMNVVAASGWFTAKDLTPSGALLWLLWGGEAVVFLGIFLKASTWVGSVVWCEACDEPMGGGNILDVAAGSGLADLVKRGSVSGLDGLRRADEMTLERMTCHVCRQCNYAIVAVDGVTKRVDKDGKITEASKVLLPRYVVPPGFVERARALLTPA